MLNHDVFDSALQQPWTAIYAKIMALVLLYGATVHISNIAGFGDTPWISTPLLWRGMDMALVKSSSRHAPNPMPTDKTRLNQ